MTDNDKKDFTAMLQLAGEQTRAFVMVEMRHSGFVTIKANGNLADVSFCNQNLEFYVMETLSGRLAPPPEGKRR